MLEFLDKLELEKKPVMVYTIIGLNILIYLWDRNFGLFGPNSGFADLAMRPAEILLTLRGQGDPMSVAKVFTSMFLHGNLMHIIGNVIFLFTFGPPVEKALGGPRFAIQYLFWGLVAAACHVYVDPHSMSPTLGASGAIGGVLGSYFILFPGSKISILLWPLPEITIVSWLLLGAWFAYQILLPQQGVANWAHAGGFMAGMATILILGGRNKVLAGREEEFEEDFEDDDEDD